jgi:hypothetical protein
MAGFWMGGELAAACEDVTLHLVRGIEIVLGDVAPDFEEVRSGGSGKTNCFTVPAGPPSRRLSARSDVGSKPPLR